MSEFKYKYTQSWFLDSEIYRYLLKVCNGNLKYNILEIGCFEGLSSVFFSDNMLNHELSTLTCVDPYFKSGSVEGITSKYVNDEVKETFLENIKKSKNFKKIQFHNMMSDTFFSNNQMLFDFIYIDGCHDPPYLTRDLINSFKFLNHNGIIWLDDYGGGNPGAMCKDTIDKCLNLYKGKYTIIHKGYQLAIRKI